MKSFVTIDLAAYEFQPMLGKPFGCISVSDLQCQESHLSVDYFPIHRKEKQKQKNNSYFLFYQVKNAPNLNYMEIIEELA